MTNSLKPYSIRACFSLFVLFFVFLSGLFENLLGIFPNCIGVCNNPEIRNPLLLAQIICVFSIIILFYDSIFSLLYKVSLHRAFIYCAIVLISVFSLYMTSWDMDSDDRWLLYRISKNVLEHGLYYWNPGEKINISTPIVWPYFASLSHLLAKELNIDWDLSIKLLGLTIYFFTAIYIFRMQVLLSFSKIFIFAGIVTYFPLTYWSISGLETGLASLLLVIAVYEIYLRGFTVFTGLLFGSIIYIRPEFVIAPAAAMITHIFLNRKNGLLSNHLNSILSLGLLSTIWLSLNFFIWGDPFPTPFYLKSIFHNPFHGGLSWSFRSMNAFVHLLSSYAQSIFLTTGICILLYASTKLFTKTKGRYFSEDTEALNRILALFVGFSCVSLYHIVSGYMHMSYVFRYFVPENIALLTLSGFALNEVLKRTQPNSLFLNSTFFGMLLIQICVLCISGFYARNVELSLTRAKHRDAFSGSAYSSMMIAWRNIGYRLKSVEVHGDRLWAKDGTNLAGASITNMYSLDGYYSPLKMSKFKSISTCTGAACANHFNYIMIRSDDAYGDSLKANSNFSVFLNESGVTVYKNLNRVD